MEVPKEQVRAELKPSVLSAYMIVTSKVKDNWQKLWIYHVSLTGRSGSGDLLF